MSQKGSRKSRSGCLACRSKRIKCDETKPQCITCTSRRQHCPGYQQPLKWSTKYEIHLNNKPRLPSLSSDATGEDSPVTSIRATTMRRARRRTQQQIMPRTTSSTTSNAKTEKPEFMAAYVPDPNGRFVQDDLSASVTGDPADPAPTADIGLAQHAFEEHELWADHNRWLEDLQSFDAFPTLDVESYASIASITPCFDSPQLQFDMQSPEASGQKSVPAQHPDDEPTCQAISQTGVRLYRLTTPQTLTHIPTFLIDYWFHTVCATWNGFDSAKNMNRNVALETFAHSEGLAYSLQSMAAAYLAEHLPHFRETAVTMTQAAVYAIRRELNQGTSPLVLPKHLLLSMFCIGTSACWTDPLQFGLPFLKEIKAILGAYNPSRSTLSPDDRNAWAFFNNSTLYWDMLCSIIGVGNTGTVDSPPSLASPSPSPTSKDQDLLHPWTGASAEIFVLFSESISLCRAFRTRMRQDHRPTALSLRAALHDIEEAQKLHQRLKSFSIPSEREIADTDDELTPKSHLVQIAEAYRLAALTHLRQTFSDLTPERTEENGDLTVDTDDQVLDLGLEIIRILEKIPLTSGTRCIQPLLCLTAGIVLKLDVAPVEPQQRTLAVLNEILSTDLRSPSASSLHDPQSEGPQHDTSTTLSLTKRSIDVGQGRRFVLERFSVLESSLPPKPIRVVKQLVQTVWAAYDGQGHGSGQVHWIDIMAQSNLRTIFG